MAAGVVGEAMVCLVLADDVLRKLGGDSLEEVHRSLLSYRAALRAYSVVKRKTGIKNSTITRLLRRF